MKMKYDGLRDPHLNVFYCYGDKQHIENNITKAFVNTLESLSDENIKIVAKELFGYELPDGKYSTAFYLQKKPKEEMVRKYEKRIMFAFSPTGKSWGYDGLDIKDKERINEELESSADKMKLSKEDKEKYIAQALEEIEKIRNEQGSIPDGWLFVDADNKPIVAIAMENKLYDLDPFQLNNHIEKSLYLITKDEKQRPVYHTYQEIVSLFSQMDVLLCNQFIEYLTILGYVKVNDFSLACQADEQIRQSLVREFGKTILEMVHPGGEIDNRNWEMASCKVNYDYLHEINLAFRKERIELWLSFGPTQNSSKKMMSVIDEINIMDEKFDWRRTFHLQRGGGRGAPNIKDSYILSNWTLPKYISYWKNNIDKIRASTIDQTISLINELYDCGDVEKECLDRIIQRLSRYNKEKSIIYVVPEISLVCTWTYEDAAAMELDRFVAEIETKVEKALNEMKLK